jgi:hypothetical protein
MLNTFTRKSKTTTHQRLTRSNSVRCLYDSEFEGFVSEIQQKSVAGIADTTNFIVYWGCG